jgi:hypothetical protein
LVFALTLLSKLLFLASKLIELIRSTHQPLFASFLRDRQSGAIFKIAGIACTANELVYFYQRLDPLQCLLQISIDFYLQASLAF